MSSYYYLAEDSILINNYLYPRVLKVEEDKLLVYALNSTGIKILSLCDGTNTIEQIIRRIANYYDVSEEVIKDDVESFVKSKMELGIIKASFYLEKHSIDLRGREEIMLPYQLSVETTKKCQLKCKHCYDNAGCEREDELEVAEIIDVLEQYRKLGGVSVMLTGGELFLKDKVEELIQYVAENFFRIVLLSNGCDISNDILKVLVRFKDKIAIQISVDGLKENHDLIRGVDGAFDKTMRNIDKLVSMDIPVTISSVLNEYNYKDIEYLTEKVKEMGCMAINIGAVSAIGRAKKTDVSSIDIIRELPEIVDKIREKYADEKFWVSENLESDNIRESSLDEEFLNKCGAGYKILHLFSDGKIGICPSNGGIIDQFYVGDVRKESLEKILRFENMSYLLNIPTPTKDLCGDCDSYEECGQCIVTMLGKVEEECKLKKRTNTLIK